MLSFLRAKLKQCWLFHFLFSALCCTMRKQQKCKISSKHSKLKITRFVIFAKTDGSKFSLNQLEELVKINKIVMITPTCSPRIKLHAQAIVFFLNCAQGLPYGSSRFFNINNDSIHMMTAKIFPLWLPLESSRRKEDCQIANQGLSKRASVF